MKFIAESHNTGDIAPYLEAEGVRIGELVQAGILESIFLKADQSGAFLVLTTDDEAAARTALDSLPLAQNRVTKVELTEVVVP
ncbi:hypothetical protein KGQ20_26040 [Catenulispora sp. NF23]|uniref:hypothetical protein n=1 Tax=Catenulispora pinistramenti TaxID=2705254 RepID=UPI001BA53459|nr:hypothetical protein [Catenulispora pinistramenti]MBS2536229.1 hypothetical protein [Catenulispora pinistramenti]